MTGSFRKSGSRRASKRDYSTVQIKCSFCGNTYYARPQEAVCPKCERPANRGLSSLWCALSAALPPLGLAYALWIRPHSPVAALQGLKWSLAGALLLAAIAGVRLLF